MAGVYISYPFCSQKCSFCNFASDVYGADSQLRYDRVLSEELKAQVWTWHPETAYFGGGNPQSDAAGSTQQFDAQHSKR